MRVTAWLALVLSLAVARVDADEPPPKPDPAAKTKVSLLFPSVSELQTAISAQGLKIQSPGKLGIVAPDWSKLADRQKQLQLGSLLGYLAFAATVQDAQVVVSCLEGIAGGSKAVGIPETSESTVALKKALAEVKAGTMSQAKLAALLDDLRRDGLRDAATKLDDQGMATILAGAWLRGGSLLARQVASDADAAKLTEVFARPELIGFMEELAKGTGGQMSADQQALIGKLMVIARKQGLTKADLAEFASLAEKLLG